SARPGTLSMPTASRARSWSSTMAPPTAAPSSRALAARGSSTQHGGATGARAAAPRVIHEPRGGYGSAFLAGFAAARGTYIVMADADLTYDFAEIPRFVKELDDGAQLVMGDRMDSIHEGAMPWLNRHVGNPALSGFLNLLYKTNVSDA